MDYKIGKKIRHFREEKGLSQLKLVEALEEQGIKMSRETLSKIENSSRSVSAAELKVIADVLDVDIREFFYEDEQDSMVTFFRKSNFSQDELKDIHELQEMVKVFIQNKKMYMETNRK